MPLTLPRGHQRQRSFLLRALQRGKLPQGMLFYGGNGIGKFTLALYLTAALFCANRDKEGKPCGTCLNCRKVAENNHPDLQIIEPDGNMIKVAAIRELNDQVGYFPLETKWRVFIVDRADSMNERAQNAFLKTLEEPPPFAKFILISKSTTAFLDTILSRIQSVHFGPLSFSELVQVLQDQDLDHEEARRRAASARGSAAHALNMEVEELVELRRELLQLLSGQMSLEQMLDYAEATAKSLPKGKTAQGLSAWMETVSLILRDLCVLTSGGQPEHLFFPELVDQYRALAGSANPLDRWQYVSKLMRLSRHHPNPRLSMESVLLGP